MRSLAAKVFLIFLLAAGTAFSQDFHLYGFSLYNLEFLGTGARARAMGGAFVGIADDASALTWNPAGLIQISKAQASISGAVLRLKTENDIKFQTSSVASPALDYTKDLLNLSAGSFVAPVRIKGHPFVAAVNYQRVIDDNDASVDNSSMIYLEGTGDYYFLGIADQIMEMRTTRNLHSFQLGFGTGLYGDLSIGMSANILFGGGNSEYYAAFADTVPYYFGTQVIDTLAVRGISRVQDQPSTKGLGLVGSLMYRTEKIRIGAVIRTPFELSTEHDLKRADSLYYKSITVAGPGTSGSARPTLYTGKTKIEVPLTLGFGGSVQVTPKFMVSGDIEIRSTSSSKYFVRAEEPPTTSDEAINSFTLPTSIYFNDSTESSYYDASGDLIEIYNEFELGYESSMQVRLGAEYMLATSIGTIPLRGGIRFTQLPYRDVSGVTRDPYMQVYEGFVLGDKLSQTSLSLGTGIHWNQVWLDFLVESAKVEQTEQGITYYGEDGFDYTNTRTKSTPTFMMTFTGFF